MGSTDSRPKYVQRALERIERAKAISRCSCPHCGTCAYGYGVAGSWGYCERRLELDFVGRKPTRPDVVAWLTRNLVDLDDVDEWCEEWRAAYGG